MVDGIHSWGVAKFKKLFSSGSGGEAVGRESLGSFCFEGGRWDTQLGLAKFKKLFSSGLEREIVGRENLRSFCFKTLFFRFGKGSNGKGKFEKLLF